MKLGLGTIFAAATVVLWTGVALVAAYWPGLAGPSVAKAAISLLFLVSGLTIILTTAEDVAKGEVKVGRGWWSYMVERDESPIQFWLAVMGWYVTAGLILVGSILILFISGKR